MKNQVCGKPQSVRKKLWKWRICADLHNESLFMVGFGAAWLRALRKVTAALIPIHIHVLRSYM